MVNYKIEVRNASEKAIIHAISFARWEQKLVKMNVECILPVTVFTVHITFQSFVT